MEAGNPQVTGGEVLVNLYNLNDSDEEGLYIDKAQISEVKNDRKTDFETKNLERLKEKAGTAAHRGVTQEDAEKAREAQEHHP
jgi:hypothetical protein